MKTFILIAAIALLPVLCFSQSIYYLPDGDGCGGIDDSKKLVKKDDIYYHPKTNTPYSGTVNRILDCHASETYEMKNGKMHGKYTGGDDGYYITGYYKDGEKDGIWKISTCDEDRAICETKMESYKDGVKQVLTKAEERSYFVKDSLEIEKKKQQAKQQATAFLQKNRSAAGVITTKSGLQYKILTKGSGNTLKEGDTATYHYTLTLLDGTKLGSTYDRQFPQIMAIYKDMSA